jgi:hypothetical protein
MKTKPSLKTLQEKIKEIQKKILALGPLHPGSVSLQSQVCGRPGCRCQHPTKPKRHGPYRKLSYVHRGKKACRFVRADCVKQIKNRLKTYKDLRKLTDKWIELSIQWGQIEFFSPQTSQKHRRK